ncbi:MAG: hypothetical protein HY070_04410 [Chloroflexi bacterium]|nr:hypothetical protein [Chloroflexota bacterium]
MIAGDGCITRAGRVFKLEISCDAAYPELITTFQNLVEKLTGLRVGVYKVKRKNCFRVVANSATLPTLLGLPPGAKSKNGFAIPDWIFESVDCVKAFAKGLIETDGTVARVHRHGGWYWHVHFSASNAVIMSSFLRATEILGYTFQVNGPKAYLSNTPLTKQLIADLGITKLKAYVYP